MLPPAVPCTTISVTAPGYELIIQHQTPGLFGGIGCSQLDLKNKTRNCPDLYIHKMKQMEVETGVKASASTSR